MPELFLDSGATFSEDRKYRQLLWRIWDASPLLNCLMLNPSKAAEDESDPTVTRQMERARRMGYGGLLVTNAYDLVATDPEDMKSHVRPITEQCDIAITATSLRAHRSGGICIAGWGKHCRPDRQDEIVRMFSDAAVPLYCLGKNKDGSPKHPLYVGYGVQPVKWP